ncbi:hypothetical protein SNE40_006744 [Patella caerulea]|uniref:Fringe-like glycosyltransferase domain-containing protein n=1 Tax=Patella caerulea TaxID=87958 RepID=A0AAN8K4G4_PATCE
MALWFGNWNTLLFLYFYILSQKGNLCSSEENLQTEKKDVRLRDLVFIVLSQSNTYHKQRAKEFNHHFHKQLKDTSQEDHPELYLLHKKWPSTGSWTIFPILQNIAEKFKEKSWVIFVEEETRIDLSRLVDVLNKYDYKKDYFLGKALYDKSPTIIHHFAFFDDPRKFGYPDPAAGMCFSQGLLTSLAERLATEDIKNDFTIDYKHELAMFIWKDGKGVNLTNVEEFCTISDSSNCVTTSPFIFPKCGSPVSRNDIYVAVKTCEKFHKDRIPIVKATWGKENIDIEYFSETEDSLIPTIDLGIPNTERGHCGKTLAIMKRFVEEEKLSSKQWLLIADDDTIINLKRLRRLLSCYNWKENIALGERYGYALKDGHGYDYITGGGGMVFSRSVVKEIASQCNCPSNESPDDMILGMCLKRMKIPIIHSKYFHQARPEDYSSDYLSDQLPVSFHKHWMVDAYKVYDLLLKGDPADHDEL